MPETSLQIGNDTFRVSLLDFETTCDLLPLILPAAAEIARLYALLFGEAVRAAAATGSGALSLDGKAIADLDIDASVVLKLLPALSAPLADASAIIATVCDKLPPERLRYVRRTLLAGATMNGTPLYATAEGQQDMAGLLLRGRTIDGWRLMLHALKANYPDFFGLIRRGKGEAPAAASPSP